jgi:hypothetical protein
MLCTEEQTKTSETTTGKHMKPRRRARTAPQWHGGEAQTGDGGRGEAPRERDRTTKDWYTPSPTVGYIPTRPERSEAKSKGGESSPTRASTSLFGLRSA